MKTKTKNQKQKAKVKKPKSNVAIGKSSKEPKEFSIPIYNSNGERHGNFSLHKKIFTGKVDKAILYQAVLMYNANQRQGTASTKTRGDVSGGGKKPWRQKGTGRARAGSIRSPLWRGGGVIFGPHPRDFHYSLPKKMKRLAFLSSINSKLNENKVIAIDSVAIEEPKTKRFLAILDALKLKGKSLFVLDTIDEKIIMASRNLEEVVIRNYKDFNTMDVLSCDNLVMSKIALEKLPERIMG